MRILLGVLLVAAAAAWAGDREDQEAEIRAAKERVQAMLDEAALLEQAGRKEDAAHVREEAAMLKKKIAEAAGRLKGGDAPRDPVQEAMHHLEKAIVILDKAGHERAAQELREAAGRLRGHAGPRERDRGPGGGEVDFWRRNTDTLRLAMKALAEAEKRDATDLMERAIHAREILLSGRRDAEAREIMERGPDDAQLSELLHVAADCWREYKQPDKAGQCMELSNFLRKRATEGRGERREARDRPGPEDRMAHVEERLERLERMLHEAFERLEERERERERDRDRDRERGRDRR